MQIFSLKLTLPNSITYEKKVPVFLGVNKDLIGLCEITHADYGTVGEFKLHTPVRAEQFVVFLFFDSVGTSPVKLEAISIRDNAQNGHIIGNMMVTINK